MEQGGKCTRTKRNLKPCSEHHTRESVHYNVFNGLVRKGEAKKKKKRLGKMWLLREMRNVMTNERVKMQIGLFNLD